MEKISKVTRSRIMRSIKSKDTKPERMVRECLKDGFEGGTRDTYMADILYPDSKVAVFIDGDFWHGKVYDAATSKMSPAWKKKMERNMRRDRYVNVRLMKAGYEVLRYWESDILARCELICDEIRMVVALRKGSNNQLKLI